MESATRYLQTIESLMVENSRLQKELQDAIAGKLPSRIVSLEEADQCFNKIADIMGPVARGSLLTEVATLCNEFKKVGQEYAAILAKANSLDHERAAIDKAINGTDVVENGQHTMFIVKKVVRLRAVLEVIKTRLDRLCLTFDNPDLAGLRKEVAGFLGGETNGR